MAANGAATATSRPATVGSVRDGRGSSRAWSCGPCSVSRRLCDVHVPRQARRRRGQRRPRTAVDLAARRDGSAGCGTGPTRRAARASGGRACASRACPTTAPARWRSIAAPPGEMDDLGVEDDAGDLLALEEVAPDLAAKALEAALRVGHGAGDPGSGERRGRRCRAARRWSGWLARRSVPSGWTRLPSATSWSARASVSSGSWSGGVAMSASAKMTRSPVAASMPACTAAPLPACGRRRTRRLGGVPSARGWASGRASTMAAVSSALPSSTTSTSHGSQLVRRAAALPGRAAPLQVAEQLVERRADPLRLVVGGQHDGQAGRRVRHAQHGSGPGARYVRRVGGRAARC